MNVSRQSTIRCKVKFKNKGTQSSANVQLGLGLVNSNTVIMGRANINAGGGDIGKHTWNQFSNWSQLATLSSISYSTSEYYTLEVIFNNGSVTYNVYDKDDTLLASTSTTETVLGNSNSLTFTIGWNTASEVYVKDITVL